MLGLPIPGAPPPIRTSLSEVLRFRVWDLCFLPSHGTASRTIEAMLANTWYHAAVTFTGFNPTNSDKPTLSPFIGHCWTPNAPRRTRWEFLSPLPAFGWRAEPGHCRATPRNITSNPGNNEGLPGSIDEVRISQVCLKPDQMAFFETASLQVTLRPPEAVSAGAQWSVDGGATWTTARIHSRFPLAITP